MHGDLVPADRRPAAQRASVLRAGGDIEQLAGAWSKLVGGAEVAAEELVRLATSGRSEFVRYSAATAVLDRVGFGKVEGLVVGGEAPEAEDGRVRTRAMAVLEARMAALSARRDAA